MYVNAARSIDFTWWFGSSPLAKWIPFMLMGEKAVVPSKMTMPVLAIVCVRDATFG